ncbi:polysaccharide deacetylase family protein [Candidatus Gottesmanbacteria bacterium]|nr:polysaccharide deacetylase family protein [Candidatus Gottesmanbacteria bacterium]
MISVIAVASADIPIYKTDEKGYAIQLDGNSSLKTRDGKGVDFDQFYLPQNQSTWNIWVRQNEYTNNAALFGKYEPLSGKRSYLIRTSSNNSVSVILSGDGINSEVDTSSISQRCGIRNNDEWTMITVVYNGTDLVYYRNGIKCSSDQTSVKHIFNSDTNLSLGYGNKVYFNGMIDDAKIYQSSLDRYQVMRLYEESLHGKAMGNSVTVLLYHKIMDVADEPDEITPRQFEDQMNFLKWNGYKTVTTKDFSEWQKGNFSMPEKAVIIIFDDGWKTTKERALPIMEARNLTGNVAVITNYADGLHGTTTYMNWSDMNHLKDKGWGLMAHGIVHKDMLNMTEVQFREQLTVSKEKIQNNTGVTPESFVFPYHRANQTYTTICAEYYELCWTRGEKATIPRYTYFESNGHDYATVSNGLGLRRITISNATTMNEFTALFGRQNNIVGEWRMEEGAGTYQTKDNSRYNNHMRFVGNPQWINNSIIL